MKQLAVFLIGLTLTGCTSVPLATHVNPNSVGLKVNEMLLLKSDQGRALIDFTHFADQDGVSTYRWRFLPANGGREEAGKGEVFEKYERNRTGPDKYDVKDIGCQLTVKAGTFRVEWSYSSTDAGWLYVDKTTTQVTVLPDTQFDSYKLDE